MVHIWITYLKISITCFINRSFYHLWFINGPKPCGYCSHKTRGIPTEKTRQSLPAAQVRPSDASSLPSAIGRAATPRGERALPQEGSGESRVPVAPAASRGEENTRVSHHRFTGTPGLPCAMVLTVSSALSLVTGLCCHHHRRDAKHHRRLDASIGASGPHGFAVRKVSALVFGAPCVHRIPPRVRDDREPPLCGTGR